ncbi:PREDICTED: uncharacterized protein LOC104809709 [Tarenaya hassleriana]|uniref:uncharacterized protein LOC104809709 n=1 Tax=Tarenaya hassleriana TaxID=28532 RepID=UPI00053C5746|nr:PREDICTED: uncharacterized protein LOC104809709 [Tarenaya hassleriana]
MKGRSAHSADLLVCFPSRSHLALPPKPISSPARPSDSKNRRHVIPLHRRHVSKLVGGHVSPLLWAKHSTRQVGSTTAGEIAEPTSPKVTCAGQIKVRPSKRAAREGACKNWQSVMEEIERIHSSRSQGRFFGFKKDVMGFLTCLRNVRFDFRCFGSFPHNDISTEDEEDREDNQEEEDEIEEEEEESSRTVFPKWFMVLQENQNDGNNALKRECERKRGSCDLDNIENGNTDVEPAVPPPNALLLMRCRSAPAKSWLEEQKTETEQEHSKDQGFESTVKREEGREDQEKDKEKKKKKDLRSLMEEENMNLVVMRYDTEFYRLSSDIAKETWVVGGIKDPLSRSRSWKR